MDAVKTFSDDPLRILRSFRFATKLNFHIVDETSLYNAEEAIYHLEEDIKYILEENVDIFAL